MHKHEHPNKMEMDGNDWVTNIHANIPNMVQPSSYTNSENNEPVRPKGDRSKDTRKHNKQTKTEIPLQGQEG